MEAVIFEHFGKHVVDLRDDAPLPEGWQFVLHDNRYTGWSLPGCCDQIVLAVVEPVDE